MRSPDRRTCALLERYGELEHSELQRNRFQARLAKARALADRATVRDSGALASVRAIRPSRGSVSRDQRLRRRGETAATESPNEVNTPLLEA